MSDPEIVCEACSDCTDFYYESRHSESKHIGWKCLDCRAEISNIELISLLDVQLIEVKISCIAMDMQSEQLISTQDSSHGELKEQVLRECTDEQRWDEEFIIERLNIVSGSNNNLEEEY